MTPPARDPAIAQLGERLREARLQARLTVREAAARVGLRNHGTLVQYEQGRVLPPLDRLALLARVYAVAPASLLVAHDALAPLITLLERASPSQVSAFARLLEQIVTASPDAPLGEG